MSFRLNQKVEVLNKNCFGIIKYVGLTSFQPGSWVGIVLDEPLGKNNGTVQGRTYFKCRENHGIFVRPDQVVLVSGNNSRASSRRSSISIDDDNDIAKTKRRSLVGEKELKSKPTSLPRSRVSRNPSKLSLSNSRNSLNESGIAANLNSPLNQNELDNSIQNSLTKCESFIETDFVENLTPEFKQPLSRSYLQQSIDEKYYLELQETNVKLVGESENLRKQLQDLNEKHEKLQKMLNHDKEKTKDFDVLQLQNEKLNEFKTKIMENHQILQRELQKTKNELEDMQNLRDNHSKEMNEMMNLLEMATLDKEVAEEGVEMIQADLDSCHEKIAELELNLKVLKEELESRHNEQCGEGSDDATKNSYQVKQMEQQNERLREVLIKMRDIAATEKSDHQKLVKEFETKKSEISELSKIKEKLSSRVEEQENKILELQAQIDATLGSEEMIVLLTDQNLNFRDKIENLENNLTDSQNLIEVLEQINEANQDINLQLREEIDLSKNSVAKLTAKNESLMEVISDRELTIGKFRDLVQQLHKQLSKMKEALSHQQQELYSSLPSVSFVDNIDFNKIFSETKAYLQNVDIDLRKIEVQELLQHVKYLMSFMPDSFDSSGGDYYSVLTLLLISRLNFKTDVLLNHVRDRFTNIEELNKKSILKDHFLKQFMFRHRLSTLIGVLQCLLHQYSYALNMCSVKTLNNATEYYNEMMSQEKVVNQFLDLLKKNQLDENQNLEPLERSIIYFYTMLPLLMNEEAPLYHQTDLLNDFINLLGSSFEELQSYISVLKQLALTNAVGSHEFEQLVEFCLNCLNKWNQLKKVLKRKLNSNSNGSSENSLGLEKDFFENVFLSYFQSLKVSKCLMRTIEEAIVCIQSNSVEKQAVVTATESEATEIATEIDCNQLMCFAAKSSAAIYEQDDLGPFVSIKESLDFVMKNVEFLVDHFEKNDSNTQKNNFQLKCKPPIVVKAELFKKELSDVKALRQEIERKDLDFQSLKQKMFGMQESVSEMKLRKEIAEKKLDNMQNYKVTIEELTQERDQLKLELSLRSKEHENVCNILQEDIDGLEKERNNLKEKLKYSVGRKSLGSNLLNDNFSGLNEVLVDDVKRLKRALKAVNSEKTHLVFRNLIDTVSRWKPIKCFTVKDIREDKLMTLKRELNEIYDSMLSVHLEYKLIDWSDRSEAFKILRDRLTQKCKLQQLNSRFGQVQRQIRDELMSRQIGAKVFGDFKDFPTIGLVEALKENEPLLFGTIQIPNLSKKTKQNHISVLVDNNYELKNIVNCLNI